jgi:hypothetical protein
MILAAATASQTMKKTTTALTPIATDSCSRIQLRFGIGVVVTMDERARASVVGLATVAT